MAQERVPDAAEPAKLWSPRWSSAANRLGANKQVILETWGRRVQNLSPLAARLSPNDLNGKISDFLDELEWALRPETPDEVAPLMVCREHGEQRSRLTGYTLRDVVQEYSVLRQVLCAILQQDFLLNLREQSVVLNSIDQAVSQAIEEYSRARESERASETNRTHVENISLVPPTK